MKFLQTRILEKKKEIPEITKAFHFRNFKIEKCAKHKITKHLIKCKVKIEYLEVKKLNNKVYALSLITDISISFSLLCIKFFTELIGNTHLCTTILKC